MNKEKVFQISQTVYGPVKSWRFGQSLGIDPLFYTSTCSFNCLYCQLGHIQNITTELKVYVPTEKVLNDYRKVANPHKINVIMYSGSGEPTLAKNLGDISQEIKQLSPQIPQAILTNAVHLGDPQVQENLQLMDKVIIKLDAPNNKLLQTINRPAPGVTLEKIIQGIQSFKKHYSGDIEVQIMFMPLNKNTIDELCTLLREIGPSQIQLNTPQRAYPLQWHRENRGNHLEIYDHETRTLKTVSPEEAKAIEQSIHSKMGLPVLSIFHESG